MSYAGCYVFDLENDVNFVLVEFDDEFSTDFRIGYMLQPLSRFMSMTTSLVGISPDVGGFDLRFGIRVQDVFGTHESTDYAGSRKAVRDFVPKHARSEVLTLVLDAISFLLAEINPDVVLMTTAEPGMPVAAFAKYDQIENLLVERAGYVLEDKDVYDDYHTYWVFSKASRQMERKNKGGQSSGQRQN